VGIRIAQDFLKVVAASGMGSENESLGAKAVNAQLLLDLSKSEIDEFLETAGRPQSGKVVACASVGAGVVAAREQKDGGPLPARARILACGIAEIEPAERLYVAAEVETPRVLARAALGVPMKMDYDVSGLWLGAEVIPYDDEVRPPLAAVCGEQRYAVHFQVSAFPGALTGGLGSGVLGDLTLGIGGLRFGGWRGVGCRVRGCGIGSRGFRGCSGIGESVVREGSGLRSGRGAAGSMGAKCLNGSTIEAAVCGQADRALKEADRAARGGSKYAGDGDAETESGELRLNHSDDIGIGSAAKGGRRHGRLHE
jgi:hypothetical protein